MGVIAVPAGAHQPAARTGGENQFRNTRGERYDAMGEKVQTDVAPSIINQAEWSN
jgi:hypothetical protein